LLYKRPDFWPEIHQIPFGGLAPPGPGKGANCASPDPVAAIRGPTSKGREKEGEGRGREGRGRTGKGKSRECVGAPT